MGDLQADVFRARACTRVFALEHHMAKVTRGADDRAHLLYPGEMRRDAFVEGRVRPSRLTEEGHAPLAFATGERADTIVDGDA